METVARDLRPKLVGATIVGARTNWARTLRRGPGRLRGRRHRADGRGGGRRAKQVVIELSGEAALTIHLKMTGQLFVVPAERPDDPYVRLVLELEDGRELRFRDIRKFGKIGLYGARPRHRRARRGGRRPGGLRGARPRAARPDFTLRDFPPSRPPAEGSAQAVPDSTSRSSPASETSMPTRRSGGPAAPAAIRESLRPPDERRLYEAIRGSWPRRSSGAARRSTTTPRPTAMARCRSTCRSTSGPASRAALRPPDQADRHRRAVDPLLLVVPAPPGG